MIEVSWRLCIIWG